MAKDTDTKEGVVKLNEKVTVYATAKSKHYKEGEEFEVHPILADKLVEAGKATKTASKNKK